MVAATVGGGRWTQPSKQGYRDRTGWTGLDPPDGDVV